MADKLDARLRSLEDEIFYQIDLKLMKQLRSSLVIMRPIKCNG